MQYTVNTIGYRKFEVLDSTGALIGKLHSHSLFSGKEQLILSEHEVYDIKQKSFWSLTRQIFKNGYPFATIKPNLSGGTEIIFQSGITFYFKSKNFWRTEYVLTDYTEQLIARLHAEYVWKKFNYNYRIDVVNKAFGQEIDALVPLLMGYCITYLGRLTASAV